MFECRFGFLINLFILTAALAASAATLTICPDHGVKASFTGNKKFIYTPKKQIFCEYSHPSKTPSGVHKFWADCQ